MKAEDKGRIDEFAAMPSCEESAESLRGLGVRFARSGVSARAAADSIHAALEESAERFREVGVRFARSGVDARDAADSFGAALYAAVAKAELMGTSREVRGGRAGRGFARGTDVPCEDWRAFRFTR